MGNQLRLVETPARKPDDDGFNTFYAAYPRHIARADAQRAWRQIRPNAQLRGEIQDGLRRATEHWQANGTDKQFIPYPASWLRGRRWEDEHDDDDPFSQLK